MGCGCQKEVVRKLTPVLEVKSEPCPVLFLTLEQEGTLEEHPAVIGKYNNVLVVYKGSSARVMYDSQGIPSVLVDDVAGEDDFNNLKNRPKYIGEVMTSDTDIPEVPETITSDDFNNLWA